MSKEVEFKQFVDIITGDYGELKDILGSSDVYNIVYTITKEFGLYPDIKVRGKFDNLYNGGIDMFSGKQVDYNLKQVLYNFNILFSEDTVSNIDSSESYTVDNKRRLLVIDKWESASALKSLIDDKMKSGEFDIFPTDLVIEDMFTNDVHDEISETLKSSNLGYVTLWYIRREVDFYASFRKKDAYFHEKYVDDKEIFDVTGYLQEILDVANMPVTIVDDMIKFGQDLFDSGVKCIEYNSSDSPKHITRDMFENMCGAYLVYLAETYGMEINTTYDESFCRQYNIYRRCPYCLAEDLFNDRSRINKIMLYATRENRRFLYIRGVKYRYTYYYIRLDDVEKMLLGDGNVHMHKWNPSVSSELSDHGQISSKQDIMYTEIDDIYRDMDGQDEEDESASNNKISIVPLFQVIDDEERLSQLVDAFNKYNNEVAEVHISKYITIRDLLCRKVMDGEKEVIQIGYIYAVGEDTYNNRISEDIIVSGIDVSSPELINRSYFKLSRNLNRHLYNAKYVYDLASAPRSLVDLIVNTDSIDDELYDPAIVEYDENDVPQRDVALTLQEKFLYYTISKYMPTGKSGELRKYLADEKKEYKVAIAEDVYMATSVLNEMKLHFDLRNLVDAKFINMYGHINSKFIKSSSSGTDLLIKNELFGVMHTE